MFFEIIAFELVPVNSRFCYENTRSWQPTKKNSNVLEVSMSTVSILSHVSKTFEWIMYKQIDTSMRDTLSKLLTGFRRNHNTQAFLDVHA